MRLLTSLALLALLTSCASVTFPQGDREITYKRKIVVPVIGFMWESEMTYEGETEGATTLIGKDDRLRSLADLIDATSDPETRARLRAEYHALSSVYREEIRRNMEGETTLERKAEGPGVEPGSP